MIYNNSFFLNFIKLLNSLELNKIDLIVNQLARLKKNKGRVFFIGVGGSAANCSHAVNDFRKICNIESYAPMDNFSEISARINDDGWDNSLSKSLEVSNLNSKDCIFILSVGGGNIKKKVSMNIVKAIDLAKKMNSKILGITARDGGYAFKKSKFVYKLPEVKNEYVTPFAESMQSVILHYIVSHENLKKNKTKW